MMDNDLKKSTEKHRFYLAMLFIAGFLVIMFVALLGELFGNYTDLKDLAAIFSGWITAVIGFYFLQQNTERAQLQTGEAMKEASDARKTSESATKKTAKLASVSKFDILDIKGAIEKQKRTIEKQKEFINEIISTLEALSEPSDEETS